jgi:serine/threonine protein kinase
VPTRSNRKSALYEGHDTRPARKVAIKLLSPNLAAYPGYLEQFESEAQTAAELDHPNICRIYEHNRAPLRFPRGGDREVHYICMQMLDGGSLVERLEAPEECNGEVVAKWLDIVANALEDAHSHGVVHSGLKPTSIVFNAAGTPYVTDFAIATRSENVGTTSLMFGAPDYLSPEQWDRQVAGPASDQYSLACLSYRVLTGVVPFENQIDHGIRDDNFKRGPLPAHNCAKQKGRPPLPEATSAVLAKALSVDPAGRYKAVTDFAHAFRHSLGERRNRLDLASLARAQHDR